MHWESIARELACARLIVHSGLWKDNHDRNRVNSDSPSMEISGEYRLVLGREDAWRALMDPEVLRRCIPGCDEFERLGDGQYRARVKLSIGPVKATFQSNLEITAARPPESYRLQGEGKAGAVGFGQGFADVKLEESGNTTILSYRSEFQVGGRLAQLGSRLVAAATRKLADDFFSRLAAVLDEGAERLTPEVDDKEPRRFARITIAACAALIAVIALWLVVAGIAD